MSIDSLQGMDMHVYVHAGRQTVMVTCKINLHQQKSVSLIAHGSPKPGCEELTVVEANDHVCMLLIK